MGWGETFEDEVLNQVSVESCLAQLNEEDRRVLEMSFRLRRPSDYGGPWPPTYTDIGRYIGQKYGTRPLTEATIRYRRKELIAVLRRERGPFVGTHQESTKIVATASTTTSERLSTTPTAARRMDTVQYETVYLPRYLDQIEAMATRLSMRDADLFEDLKQTGMITLWELDLNGARTNEDAYIRTAIWNRMCQFLRTTRPRDFKSLQKLLDDGDQIVKDPTTGQATFVDRFVGRRGYLEEDRDD